MDRQTERKGAMKSLAFSRKPTTEPPFSRKRNRHCIGKRKSKHRREIDGNNKRGSRDIDRKNRRGSKAAVCIRPKKACYEASIQSEDQPTLSQVEKERSEADTAPGREREGEREG
jgi:hypothetical protein